MKILIACDKFKGSLTAPEACSAIEAGIVEGLAPGTFELRSLPVADGGDGMARSLTAAGDGEWVTAEVRNALGDPITAGYGLIDKGGTAIIEMAEASGLAQLNPKSLDPWNASTYGTGELILNAARRGAEKIVLGIGGSATNDGGTGMARAVGFQFFDANGREILSVPAELEKATAIRPPTDNSLPEITVACDVKNPLQGPLGCTYGYGPQKGVEPDDLARHEDRISHLVQLLGEQGMDASAQPGAGAAGGLGFGCLVFLKAHLVPGFDLVSGILKLEEAVNWADLVITGEGKLDHQSIHGKAPYGVVQLAAKLGKPTAAFCGLLESRDLANEFGPIREIRNPDLSIEANMQQGATHLKNAAVEFIPTLLLPSS